MLLPYASRQIIINQCPKFTGWLVSSHYIYKGECVILNCIDPFATLIKVT